MFLQFWTDQRNLTTQASKLYGSSGSAVFYGKTDLRHADSLSILDWEFRSSSVWWVSCNQYFVCRKAPFCAPAAWKHLVLD